MDWDSINTIEEASATMQPDTVKRLNFRGLELTQIPSVVYRFKNLVALSLDDNYLTSIPKNLKTLKKLTFLSMDHNFVTDDSISFTRNKKIQYLKLRYN
ncbi:MAG: leucine-rich repeat domain-containing protein, partial [Spirosomataceae bacterium]